MRLTIVACEKRRTQRSNQKMAFIIIVITLPEKLIHPLDKRPPGFLLCSVHAPHVDFVIYLLVC